MLVRAWEFCELFISHNAMYEKLLWHLDATRMVGNMIQAESDAHKRDEYLQKLKVLPNQRWMEIIAKAHQNVDFLKDVDVTQNVLNILMYTELISKSIAEGGPLESRTSYVKLLHLVKRETLKLIETFLDKSEDQPRIGKQFVPPIMNPVLGDYARNVPDAMESEVVSFCDNRKQDTKDLYAEEAAAPREKERQSMLSISGLVAPSDLQDEMVDS
ncbi:hypothetical protein VNO78_07599 [Psophocarpus tetragonolobus]|uniref:Exportin-1 C-terminal domain-containing protein n=1 Tax=Psophocarpus tetragonolobus TaxID=3891 RepID=A0AAN9T3G9_PSOTE